VDVVATWLWLVFCLQWLSNTGTDIQLTTRGSGEVTGRLLEIPGEFPTNDLYKYS
jgi:hypothetical protein